MTNLGNHCDIPNNGTPNLRHNTPYLDDFSPTRISAKSDNSKPPATHGPKKLDLKC